MCNDLEKNLSVYSTTVAVDLPVDKPSTNMR